jgi:hypothetical protein
LQILRTQCEIDHHERKTPDVDNHWSRLHSDGVRCNVGNVFQKHSRDCSERGCAFDANGFFGGIEFKRLSSRLRTAQQRNIIAACAGFGFCRKGTG